MKTENDIAFGNNLSKLRKEAKLTQAELAYRCDFDRTYIGAIERGEKSVTVNTLAKLANGLGIRIAELFNY
jgi:transcriptional regulator with XRE-family HTH domain